MLYLLEVFAMNNLCALCSAFVHPKFSFSISPLWLSIACVGKEFTQYMLMGLCSPKLTSQPLRTIWLSNLLYISYILMELIKLTERVRPCLSLSHNHFQCSIFPFFFFFLNENNRTHRTHDLHLVFPHHYWKEKIKAFMTS